MFKHIREFIFFILVQYLFIRYTNSTCSTFPVSVSKLDNCINGICVAEETAILDITFQDNFQTCIILQSNDIDNYQSFNITIVDPRITHNLHDCYITSDPQIDFQGFCGCPLGTNVDCSNCPSTPSFTDYTLCDSGIHSGKSCIAPGLGTWCIKAGFKADHRYKVCEISSANFESYVISNYQDYNQTLLEIKGDISQNLFSNQINLTFFNINLKEKTLNSKIVYDLNDPDTFFIIPNEFINSKDEFHFSKLGWYKSNAAIKVPNNFLETANIQLATCSNNTFRIAVPWPEFTTSLINNPSWNSQKVKPGSILADPHYSNISLYRNIDQQFDIDIVYGQVFESASGNPVPFGIDRNQIMKPPGDWQAWQWNISCNTGTFRLSDYTCSNTTLIYGNNPISYYGVICQDMYTPSIYGFCAITQNIADTNNQLWNCSNPTFLSYSWPDSQLYEWIFNGSFYKINHISGNLQTHSDFLSYKSISAEGFLKVDFKNVTYRFVTTNVLPKITDVTSKDDSLFVYAKSLSSPGQCVIMIDNDLAPTITVTLELKENKYELPILKNKFHGKCLITVQCYLNKDIVRFELDIEKDDVDIDYKTINSTNIREANLNKENWLETTWDWIKYPFVKSWSGLKSIWELITSSFKYLYILIIFIASSIFLYILYKLYCMIKRKYLLRKKLKSF